MVITYNDVVNLSMKFNARLQEKGYNVMCFVSGKQMFAPDYKISDTPMVEKMYSYIQGDSFIVDVVQTASKYNVPIDKLMIGFVQKAFKEPGELKMADMLSCIKVLSNQQLSVEKQNNILQLLYQLNEKLRQQGYGLYADIDKTIFGNMTDNSIITYTEIESNLEKMAEENATEKQVPIDYARVSCYLNGMHEIGLPKCIVVRDYMNTFLKKNMNYLTIYLSKIIMSNGAKCYFDVSDYKAEQAEYDAVELYHWIQDAKKKLLEVPKGKVTFMLSYQMYLDSSKDKLLSLLRIQPNMLGSAKFHIEQYEEDYKFIAKIIKGVSPEMPQIEAVQTIEVEKEEEKTDPYEQALQDIRNKLDDVMNVVVENAVQTMDGFDKVNTNIEDAKTSILARFDEMDSKLQECMENNDSEGLCELLEKKVNLLRQLHQNKYRDIIVGEDVYFLLAFISTDHPQQAIEDMFSYLKDGKYKTGYDERISEGNIDFYSAECNLGRVIVYRKDGVIYLKNLQIKDEYLQENLVNFLEKYGIKVSNKVFFDDQIYEELDRLMKRTRKSFHIIMPWVKDWRLKSYEEAIAAMVRSNIDVHIKYGYLSKGSDEEQNRKNELKLQESKQALEGLNQRVNNKLHLKKDDTHIKAAVIDGKWCLVGSCNILSYIYDYNKNPDYRHEMMVLLEDEELAATLIKYCEGTIRDVK